MSFRKTKTSLRFSCTVFALSLLGILTLAAPAFAQVVPNNCLQDEYKAAGNSQTLGCTAGDVKVAKVINVRDLGGNALTTCTAGSSFNFIADFLVQTTSTSARSNIGLYFGTGDVNTQTTALTGTCSDNIIPPTHTCTNTSGTVNSTLTCGSTNYDELDTNEPKPNATNAGCGDT